MRKSFEENPFVKVVYLLNCRLVGPLYLIEYQQENWIVRDDRPYEEKSITDEEFVVMANARSLTAATA